MTNQRKLFSLFKNDIDAKTILSDAKKMLTHYAGRIWTDTETHDPGITLLEAISYGVSDVAYRYTRPFTDLLTPSPDMQASGGGVFPEEFGPQKALTCSPVTPDDYRRAILDLHSDNKNDGYFYFSNVCLLKEPEKLRYQYWYDADEREFHFSKPKNVSDDKKQITLLGNYHLYLIPSPEAEKNPNEAIKALDDFLLHNRNLGEAISDIIWLKPEDIHPNIVVDLNEEVGSQSNIASILSDIYCAVRDYITPPVVRKTTSQLTEQGWCSEDIYQGPFLKHGWIPELPPEMNVSKKHKVNLSGLVSRLLDIKGIRGVRYLSVAPDSTTSWLWEAQDCCFYPRLWGEDPLEKLADGKTVQLLAKGDIPFVAKIADIKKELEKNLKKEKAINNQEHIYKYGNWRDPGRVYPITDLIPSCYDLMVPASTLQQEQLHQFMLIFEQMLADRCQQLALLPSLLSFKPKGDLVWGRQWPFSIESVSDEVHHTYRDNVKNILRKNQSDRQKALEITGFMLGYFNSRLAPDVFNGYSSSFLESQQGYLSRQTELVYNKAKATHGQISSLQRRIAARLGLGGGEIFNDNVNFDNLPFYLIEHRALLPKQPNEKYSSYQSVNSVTKEFVDDQSFLTFHCNDVYGLKVGMLLNIEIGYENRDKFVIRSQVITAVDVINKAFSLTLGMSDALTRNLDEILSAKPESLTWINSDVWLEEMSYRLCYAADQSGLAEGQKRLTCSAFPVMLEVNDELSLSYHIGLQSDHVAYQEDFAQVLTVVSIDRIANTLVVSSESPLPLDESANSYVWHLPFSYSTKDRFSFMVSAVFNQSLLSNTSSDPYAIEAWVRDVILEEIPSHLGMLLHWKPESEFRNFANTYSKWQLAASILGDRSYELMESLALGKLPAALDGVGAMYVATLAQKELVVGSDGQGWNTSVIADDQLFYVPSNIDSEDIEKQ